MCATANEKDPNLIPNSSTNWDTFEERLTTD